MFPVLLGKFDQKANLQPSLELTKPYKWRIGHKWGENTIFESREWYYIVSMYIYY